MVSFEDTSIGYAYKTDKELKRAKRIFYLISNTSFVGTVKFIYNFFKILKFPIGWIFRSSIYKQFIGSDSIEGCENVVKTLATYNVKSILGYSYEGNSQDQAFSEILKSIRYTASSKDIPFSVFKPSGLADTGLLIKVSQGEKLLPDEEKELDLFKSRFDKLCQTAFESGKPILIDAEFSTYQRSIDMVAEEMMQKYNREKAFVYNTIQMYQANRLQFLLDAHKRAVDNDYILGVKLVRGAYMEAERARAESKGSASPIHESKIETDRDFNEALKYIVMNIETIALFCGTHNEESIDYLTCLMDSYGISPDDQRIYISQLYGMCDNISFNLAYNGFNVAKSIPYAPFHLSIPYLIRRLDENTSVLGQSGRELRFIKEELKRRKKENKSIPSNKQVEKQVNQNENIYNTVEENEN